MGYAPVSHITLPKKYGTAASGEGVYIISSDGSKTIDGSSGAAVSCLGHGHKAVIEAIVDQARQLAFAHTSFFTSDPAEELASLLLSTSNGAFSKVMFLSSGSEAVESALKLARQYHLCKGDTKRVNFISRQFSYHKNTLGALSAGYNPARRAPFQPMLSPAFHHVSRCFYSRDSQPDESEAQYVARLMAEYEQKFVELGPDTVAAVVIEPVSGATLGCVPAAQGYLGALRELCDKHGALLIFDEVMCGMGRVGTLHAWQSLGGVVPDLQTIGKGLGAGYQPISAILVGSNVHNAIKSASSTNPFVSGHTYQGHAIGCAAALATQKTLVNDDLLNNVQAMGQRLRQALADSTPYLKEVRGMGLFLTVEFDTHSLPRPIAADVAAECLKNGAAVYLCSTAVDAIMLAPPFIIRGSEIDLLVAIFTKSVQNVVETCGATSTGNTHSSALSEGRASITSG